MNDVTRILCKQHRQSANPGNKTDDTDLAAIYRGGVNGFGLLEPPPDPMSVRLQLLARHRRDQVEKAVARALPDP